MESLANAEPFLSALYRRWWKVQFKGLDNLPETGPALIAGNSGGALPWVQLMLIFALMSNKKNPRRVNILMNLSWIEDERIYRALTSLGFVPWSADNTKKLLAAGELVAIFPEGVAGQAKTFSDRYRLFDFDWTMFLPAVEQSVKIYPLATLGCDESVPIFANLEALARFVGLPAYPITPFFPWLPFPANFLTLPVPWRMSILKPISYQSDSDRDSLEQTAKTEAGFVQGEIQAELNRLLRARMKTQG